MPRGPGPRSGGHGGRNTHKRDGARQQDTPVLVQRAAEFSTRQILIIIKLDQDIEDRAGQDARCGLPKGVQVALRPKKVPPKRLQGVIWAQISPYSVSIIVLYSIDFYKSMLINRTIF